MKRLLAWALFDLANTFFAVAMLSFYFPLWIMEDQGVKELVFSIALSLSMAGVAVLMPFCGAISDALGERMRFLRWTTYGCVAATIAIHFTPSPGPALALFGLANACYQLGTVFYDALLRQVSAPAGIGRSSGLGAAFGYLGSIVGLACLWPFVRQGGYQAAFAPSAALFLLFALPSFLLIREPASGDARVPWAQVVRMAALRLAFTVRSARSSTGLWWFMWASFFSLNAINTILVFMVVFTRKVMRFSDAQVVAFFIFSQLFSVAGSLVFTSFIPRVGAQRTLSAIWIGWMAALTLLIAQPSPRWLWVIGPLIGFCLGSTWATSRALVIELSPAERLGEMLGLAGLVGRASGIIGPLLWGLIVWDPARYRHAVVLLIALLAVGLWCLQRVPSAVPSARQG